MAGNSASSYSEMDGIQKAAILLITLGPEKAAVVFKHLKEDEIEQLTLEIANTRSVTPAQKEQVLNEFYEVCLAQQYIAEGGIGYAKDLLQKALGENKAQEVLGKLTASLQVRPFEFIRKTEASQILNFIQDEHPQTIALILSYLSPQQAAGIISSLTPYFTGCHQRSGKYIRAETGITCQSGLHDCRWCGFGGRSIEYSRPWYRETHYGKLGNRGTGTRRRDPKKDVCVRGYSYAGRPLDSACA